MKLSKESVAQYKNVLVVDCQWQLTSAVRDVQPDSSHAYERLESRLRVQRAALRQCLTNKPSTRHQLDMLRLVAVLSTLFVAMKRRMKVPNIARTLHNMPGIYASQSPRIALSVTKHHVLPKFLVVNQK